MDKVKLPNGRFLSYTTYGAENGVPILYNHGWPSSRFEAMIWDEFGKKCNGRIIAIDRPGMGGSTFDPNRTLLDWPNDIAHFADEMGFEKFHMIGVSGGGPFTAVCAYKIPERLHGATIIAGLAPMTEPEWKEGMRMANRIMLPLGGSMPWLLNLIMKLMQRASQNPSTMERMLNDLPDVDKAVFETHDINNLLRSTQEGFRQGTQGVTKDGQIYAKPWGFELDEIRMPVSVWQGGMDVNVPPSNGRLQARKMPNATLHFLENEGHISIIANHGEAILRDLLAS